jgi:hypothetical protein
MVPLPGWRLIGYVASALDNQESRHKHVCADVAMLDKIPDCEGKAQKTYTVWAT